MTKKCCCCSNEEENTMAATIKAEDRESRRAKARAEHEAAANRVRELRELITPTARVVEVATPTKQWSIRGLIDVVHVATRHEQPAVDPRAARRAALEMPGAELDEIEAREQLDAAEAALREVERAEYLRKLPSSDARVKAA